jgi:hypothetical protein
VSTRRIHKKEYEAIYIQIHIMMTRTNMIYCERVRIYCVVVFLVLGCFASNGVDGHIPIPNNNLEARNSLIATSSTRRGGSGNNNRNTGNTNNLRWPYSSSPKLSASSSSSSIRLKDAFPTESLLSTYEEEFDKHFDMNIF